MEKYSSLDKEIWITEFGISKLYTFSLDYIDVGYIYVQMLKYAANNKIKFFIWHLHDINSENISVFNPERYFGIVNSDLQTKESYEILRRANSLEYSKITNY
ncbi:MAG: hypothetical protein V1859_03545 [archaeon]